MLAVDSLATWAARRGVRYFIWHEQSDASTAYGPLAEDIKGLSAPPLLLVWEAPGVRVFEITSDVD
jgi:hypothetical protein